MLNQGCSIRSLTMIKHGELSKLSTHVTHPGHPSAQHRPTSYHHPRLRLHLALLLYAARYPRAQT